MENLQIITFNEIPVVTTKQIAEMYGTTSKKVSNNFNANKKRYTIGKHYFVLEGEEKNQFINRLEIKDSSKNAKKIYLWTERGALLLAKSINTDIAWEAYERLIDFYFRQKEEYTYQIQPCEPETALLEEKPKVPLVESWYARNNGRIERIMRKIQMSRKYVCHKILQNVSEKYDLDAANKLYEEHTGKKLKRSTDVIEYFPELGEHADKYLDRIENLLFPR